MGSRIAENPRRESISLQRCLILPKIQAIINRIKDRARRKAALSDRKSAAAQARMKKIASLANDERVPKKRRKGNGGRFSTPPCYGFSLPTPLTDDMFGADDADWAIYRKIVCYSFWLTIAYHR
jgi:hypothetical protein